MARTSIAHASGEVAGKSLSPELPLVGLVRGTTATDKSVADRGRWILPVSMRALDRVMSRKEAAILLGISESRLSSLAKGEDDKSLSLMKLGALGDAFWIAFEQELRTHYKLDDPAERVQQAVDMIGRGMAALIAETKR